MGSLGGQAELDAEHDAEVAQLDCELELAQLQNEQLPTKKEKSNCPWTRQ